MSKPLARANTAGLDMEHFKVYERELRKRVDAGWIPGYCSKVLHNGRVLHEDSYGIAEPQSKLKYGTDVIMRIYCMTKPMLAVAILMLQERGLLHVNDALSKYIPSFGDVRVAANKLAVKKTSAKKPKPITILHCLTHTAGIPVGGAFLQTPHDPESKSVYPLVKRVESGEIENVGHFADELAKVPLRRNPGDAYSYSFSTDVLGRVVEVVSGMSLGSFMQKEIFDKIGMPDTGFFVPKTKVRRLAAVYAGRDYALLDGQRGADLPRKKGALCRIDGKRPQDSRWMEGNQCKVEAGGGMMGSNMGALVSTVNDCSRFLGMLTNGGQLQGVRLLKEKTIERYCIHDLFPEVINSGERQMDDNIPLGWTALGQLGTPILPGDKQPDVKDAYEDGEIGGGGIACTYWSINPRRGLATVWFTQSMGNDPYVKEEENIYMAARKAVPLLPCKPKTKPVVRAKRVGTTRKFQISVQRTISKSRMGKATVGGA